MRASVLLLLLCASALGEARVYKAKNVVLKQLCGSQHASCRPTHVADKRLPFGCKVAVRNGKLYVSRSPGSGATMLVRAGKPHTWTLDKKKVSLLFEQDGEAWVFGNPQARRFRLAAVDFLLVDADCDGRYDGFGKDGYLAHGSNVVLPLAREFPLGEVIVKVRSIEPDGSALKAETVPFKATGVQLAALLRVNRYRALNGLAPVVLDPDLTRACSAHAHYLGINNWTGFTNPHTQDLGPKGASPEGAEAARSSCIMKTSPANAIVAFWRTYYHRIPLMSPGLFRVGINDAPEEIAVVHCGQYRKGRFTEPWVWADPAIVPCDRSIGIMTQSMIEAPREPVPNLAGRGPPIMLTFRRPPRLKGLDGELFEVSKRGKERAVKLLVADQWRYPTAFGLVPERPLAPSTWYRCVMRYTLDGKAVERTIRFRTEGR